MSVYSLKNPQLPDNRHSCQPYGGRNNVPTWALKFEKMGLELNARPPTECLMYLQLARELRHLDKEWTS